MTELFRKFPLLGRMALALIAWGVVIVSVLTGVVVQHATDLNMAAATLGGAILAIPPLALKLLTTLVDKLQGGGE